MARADVLADDKDVAGEVVVEVGEHRRRDEVERGDDVRIGRDGLDLGGDRASG